MVQAVLPNEIYALGIVESLLAISKNMRALHGMKLAELGFHNGQDELLIVADEGGSTVSDIAAKLVIRPSTVSKMMDRLIIKGLVERVDDPLDKRCTIVRITKKGEEERSELIKLRQKLEMEIARSFGHDDYLRMAGTLADCQKTIGALLRRHR